MDFKNGFANFFADGLNKTLVDIFRNNKNISFSGAGNSSSKAFVFSKFPLKNEKVIWLSTTKQDQEAVFRSLEFWKGDLVEKFDQIQQKESQFNKDVIRRNKLNIMKIVAKLLSDEQFVITMKYEDIFTHFPKKKNVEENIVKVAKGERIDAINLLQTLALNGYIVSEDEELQEGTYIRKGEVIKIFPVNLKTHIKITTDFDTVEQIEIADEIGAYSTKADMVKIFPILTEGNGLILDYLKDTDIVIEDELEIYEQLFNDFNNIFKERSGQFRIVEIASFMEDEANHTHLHYLSVLKYQNVLDMISDLREKKISKWKTLLITKHAQELKAILTDKELQFSENPSDLASSSDKGELVILPVDKDAVFIEPFQCPSEKIEVITDREIIGLKETGKKRTVETKDFSDFLTALKANDYIVHHDHGIGVFLGLDKKTIDDITREYLKIGYAENDKLYVPIDQADKVSKYITSEDSKPKLTRLGSAEWQTITSKVKEEAEEVAKELLQLYAKRALARGHEFNKDNDLQDMFEKSFQYEETPGQIKAINDVKKDMERSQPMDRLVCGDVGFGKTEVAMRAAFKAVQSKKQVAVITPITILADQHYKSFRSRMEEYGVRVEMLSRFQSQKEQLQTLQRLEKGEVDIVVGTHRLLSEDVRFKNLGLVIIDEEQRFGVKQKERFKELRAEVDMLTLTATPIPRTLNVSLNGLRDITTITTPPPGRLPVVTEVRRYSNGLIREAILKEIERNGQVYFLHNRVETIESMAEKLRQLVPEARFLVTHGQLSPNELENRILDFKEAKFDVLVSSTIIENGIDLPNANTLIVNSAEKFGLAQLYQLRGRVGRGKRQAYAYFLYHSERLKLDAKKRLRAIVEASELGAGFQIAMKDLEIRGAGDVLGVNQHGTINVVGVSHFMRMLNKAVDDLKEGRRSEKLPEEDREREVTIEIPLTAYIPDDYILNSKEKISVYQKLSNSDTKQYLDELQNDITENYGKMPREVLNLFIVLHLKILAREAGIINVKAENIHKKDRQEIVLQMGSKVRPENIINMLNYNANWKISGTRLRIRTSELGTDWIKALEENLIKLQGSVIKK